MRRLDGRSDAGVFRILTQFTREGAMRSAAVLAGVIWLCSMGAPVVGEAQSDPRQLEQGCDAGDLDACMEIARRCVTGREGFEKDVARTLSLYERACNGGHADGCRYLASAYRAGDIVPKDETRGLQLLQKACDLQSELGQPELACHALGVAYEWGSGVARDSTRASTLYERACDLGHENGCSSAASLYQPSTGVLKDATQWAAMMEKHCDHPAAHGVPCLQLGLAYDIGMWVPEDADHANVLFKKGCFHGNKEACELIRR
jgi:TPR repeat protein